MCSEDAAGYHPDESPGQRARGVSARPQSGARDGVIVVVHDGDGDGAETGVQHAPRRDPHEDVAAEPRLPRREGTAHTLSRVCTHSHTHTLAHTHTHTHTHTHEFNSPHTKHMQGTAHTPETHTTPPTHNMHTETQMSHVRTRTHTHTHPHTHTHTHTHTHCESTLTNGCGVITFPTFVHAGTAAE